MSCSRAHILHELGLVSFQETFSEWQFVQSLRIQWLGLSVTHTGIHKIIGLHGLACSSVS